MELSREGLAGSCAGGGGGDREEWGGRPGGDRDTILGSAYMAPGPGELGRSKLDKPLEVP